MHKMRAVWAVGAALISLAIPARASEEVLPVTTAVVTEVSLNEHPERKRSIATYMRTFYQDADQPFSAGVGPVIVDEEAVSAHIRDLLEPGVVVEVCRLVPKENGTYGPPPQKLDARLAADCYARVGAN